MAGKAVKGKSSSGKKSKKAPAKKRGVVAKAGSKVRSAAKAVKKAVRKVAKKVTTSVKKKLTPKAAKVAPKVVKPVRVVRRETDIPLDRIAQTYTPQQTSIKAGFRSSGADHQSDQEFARGVADDERFDNEDIYTNKTGDPRIGTHGRAYEPGEKKKNKAS